MARPRSDIRPRIIEAARARFLKGGVDGSSLRGIASDAGTNIGMVYYYFKTKDELFFEVVEDVYVNLLDDISSIAGGDEPADERIEELFRRLGRMTELEFGTIAIVVREALVSSARLNRLMGRFAAGHMPPIVKTLSDGVGEGVLREQLPLPLMMVCVGALGIVPQMMRRLVPDDSSLLLADLPRGVELADMLSEVALRGIAVGTEPRDVAEPG